MTYRTLITTILAIATLVGACGGGSATPGPTAQTLDGRTFLSTTVDGPALVAGTVIRITFKDGNVSVNAGCNTFGGQYRIDGDRLVVGQIVTTEIGCQPNLAAQDQWVGGLIGGATMGLDGNALILALSGIRVTFLDRVVADPDRPLLGTRWVVDGLINGGTVSSAPLGVGAGASFTFTDGRGGVEDVRLDLDTGCNTGSASATIQGSSITLGTLSLTKKACGQGLAALERAVTTVARGTMVYAIVADQLTLTTGGIGLTLRAAP